jgi:acetyl-CoA carboxylase biotin carboxyl carrier protein
MTIDEIRELIHLATQTGIAELEVQRGESRVRIRRGSASPHEVVISPQSRAAAAASSAAPAPQTSPASPESRDAAAADPGLTLVKSPIVGTYYEAPSPGAPPFVRIGERVEPGKVLCIIESMKLMNEIEAEIAGVVESKLVPNGQPVEYGEAMFGIRAV